MSDSKHNQLMVLGDEAVSHAAIDAGAKGIFGYPGTPSTEVFEAAEELVHSLDDGRIAQWAANEKVAYEMALGASYAGHRSIVTMKHVGLNVAMDAFVNSAMTGVNGGLVVLVADDPGMHSSQNEQDSRCLADFAMIPCLEPSTVQEVYDFTRKAFEISEELKLPVVLRLVTRLAHSRGVIEKVQTIAPTALGLPAKGDKGWILMPAIARQQYRKLRDRENDIIAHMDQMNCSQNKNTKGVIIAGLGRAYFEQLCNEKHELKSLAKLEIKSYPFDMEKLKKFVDDCDEVYVFEENFPFIEDLAKLYAKKTVIHGRRDDALPIDGELTPGALRNALGIEIPESKSKAGITLPARPPKLCDGCGHIDAFKSIQQALKNIGVDDPRIFGDIGCYTLGALPPYNSIDACVDMGASLGMALGASLVDMKPVIGVIGDSTFFHSGLTSLVSLPELKSNITFVVMDNSITAMTGQQKSISIENIETIAKAMGVPEKNIHTLKPLPKKFDENTKYMEGVLSHNGPDIVVFRRDCIQAMRKGLYKKFYN